MSIHLEETSDLLPSHSPLVPLPCTDPIRIHFVEVSPVTFHQEWNSFTVLCEPLTYPENSFEASPHCVAILEKGIG